MYKICCYFLLFTTLISYSQKKENLVSEISFFKDKKSNHSINTLNKVKFNSFNNNFFGLNHGTFWFKVVLKNHSSKKPIFFITEEDNIKEIEIYQNQKLLTTEKQNIGVIKNVLKINNTTNNTFYIKVKFKMHVYFPLKVYSSKDFLVIDKYNFFKSGFYYGFVITIFIINFFFFISLKDKAFLLYCFFLITTNLGISDIEGLSNLWVPNSIAIQANVIFHFLIALSGALFATNFLDLKRLYPKSIDIGIILLILIIISYVIFLITNNTLYYAFGDIFSLLVLVYYWIMGFYTLKKQAYAKFFVIGYSLVLFSGIMLIVTKNFGITYFSLSIEHVKFGALFEMLILTYAITHRVKILRNENTKFTKEIKNYVQHIFNLENKMKRNNNDNDIIDSIERNIIIIAQKYNLTERESDILLQIINGLNNPEIAEKMFISINTVKYHIRNIYQKLDVKSRKDIASIVIK